MSSHLTCMAGGKQSGGGGGKSSLGCIAQKWDIFTLHVPCGWALRREAHGARRRPTGEPGVGTDTGRRLRIRLPCQQRFAGFLDAPERSPKGASCEAPGADRARRFNYRVSCPGAYRHRHEADGVQ